MQPRWRINIVLYLDSFEGEAQHALLKLAISYRKAVMLSLVFRP